MYFDRLDNRQKQIRLVLDRRDCDVMGIATNEARNHVIESIRKANGNPALAIGDETLVRELENLTAMFMLGFAALQPDIEPEPQEPVAWSDEMRERARNVLKRLLDESEESDGPEF